MKRILWLAAIVALIAGGIGYYQYNKPHKNMASAKADMAMDAAALLADFERDEAGANAKYNDKVVEVSGKVGAVAADETGLVKVTLDTGNPMSGVICELDATGIHKRTSFNEGENVKFKCVCTGYLSDVILIRCVETN